MSRPNLKGRLLLNEPLSDPTALVLRAQAVLRANDAGRFTRPGPHQYPHQWNWDSAVIALGLAHFDLPRALTEIRSLLAGQWRDGMLPHVVYHTGPSDYFPDPAFWQVERSPDAPTLATSGITQPPLLATIVRLIHERAPIIEFVREVYPALLAWHRWLHTARVADGSGLACLIHPWESGTDDSPRWLRALAAVRPTDVPEFQRRDTIHILADERPHDSDYDRFVHLIDIFRRQRYHPKALLAQSPFLVQDVLFNAILHRADQDLRQLASELGEPVDEIDQWLATVRNGFTARFWDKGRGLFLDYDLRTRTPIPINTAMTFAPFFAGLVSAHQAERLLRQHWLNPAEYEPERPFHFRLTTVSKAEPGWEARRYWRGPVWIILNWLVADGLRRSGYELLADELRRDSLRLVAHSGFREYYDPRDGHGCGSIDFSWSAALTLEFLAHG